MAGSGTAHLRDNADDLVLQVEHLVVDYPSRRGTVHAVSDVSFDLADRETIGIVGESGCGKSTTGKAIMRIPPPTSGRVLLDQVDLSSLGHEELRQARGQMQMIFQDAISSLNPRRQIREVVGEPLEIQWLESYQRSPWIRCVGGLRPEDAAPLAPPGDPQGQHAGRRGVLRRPDHLGGRHRARRRRTPTASATVAPAPSSATC